MSRDTQKLIDALVDVQTYIQKPIFTADKNGFDTISYYFDRLVDCIRMSIGQQQIKEYLNEGKN